MLDDHGIIRVATSNPGKLRDFAGAATLFHLQIQPIPGLDAIPVPAEDAPTFEANACEKAQYYSRFVKNQIVICDDSGLEVEALGGAPGVHSARYAHTGDRRAGEAPYSKAEIDAANNAKLLQALSEVAEEHRKARFVCVIAAARDGRLLACFRGEAEGTILREFRGELGFGYDPLFYSTEAGKTFAELQAEEKSEFSHRGKAFRKFLSWYCARSGQYRVAS